MSNFALKINLFISSVRDFSVNICIDMIKIFNDEKKRFQEVNINIENIQTEVQQNLIHLKLLNTRFPVH